MKNVILAVLFLCLVLAGAGVNAHFVRQETDKMLALASTDGKASELRALLEKDEFLLSLSCNHLLLEQTEQLAIELCACEAAPEPDPAEPAVRDKLLLLISEIRDGEKFSFSGIFRIDFFPEIGYII